MSAIVAAALDVVGSAADLPVVFLNGGVLLVILITVGTALIMARMLVIEYAPWAGQHSKALADLLDAELDLIEVVVDIASVAIQIVYSVIELLAGKKPHFKTPKWHKNVVDPAELVAITHELAYGCRNYNSFDTVVVATTTQITSPFVCPIIRHTYPLGATYNALHHLTGYLSYEPTPPPFGNNCEPPDTQVDAACIAFGAGYVVLELLLPVYIVLLVGQTGLWTNTLKLVYAIVATVVKTALAVL